MPYLPAGDVPADFARYGLTEPTLSSSAAKTTEKNMFIRAATGTPHKQHKCHSNASLLAAVVFEHTDQPIIEAADLEHSNELHPCLPRLGRASHVTLEERSQVFESVWKDEACARFPAQLSSRVDRALILVFVLSSPLNRSATHTFCPMLAGLGCERLESAQYEFRLS